MLTRKINLAGITNPNPGLNTSTTIAVPGGERVHCILVKVTASTGTNLPIGNWIGDITVKLGGKPQRIHTASQLDKLNKVNGSAYGAQTVGSSGTNYGQIIPIFFAEPWRNDNDQATFLAVETSKEKLMEIEVVRNGTPSGTAPTVTITASAIVSNDKQPRAQGAPFVMKKVYRSDFPSSATLDITTLDKRDMYAAVHIAAANITKAVLKADGLPIHELEVAENDSALTNFQMDATQFDYSLVLDQDDTINSGLFAGNLNSLELRVEQSSAATITTLAERVGAPD
jgi:hypothetical protein